MGRVGWAKAHSALRAFPGAGAAPSPPFSLVARMVGTLRLATRAEALPTLRIGVLSYPPDFAAGAPGGNTALVLAGAGAVALEAAGGSLP